MFASSPGQGLMHFKERSKKHSPRKFQDDGEMQMLVYICEQSPKYLPQCIFPGMHR